MKSLKNASLAGKKVIIRAGFDVPIEDGRVVEDVRIKKSVPTLERVFEGNPRLVVVISHLGRPGGEVVAEFSNNIIAESLSQLANHPVVVVETLDELEQIKQSGEIDSNAIYLLENIRFWKGEKKGDEELAKKIGAGLDVYVNDAFSVSHRDHMSISKLPQEISEKYMGVLFEEEWINLSKVRDEVASPSVAIIGGAKIETKLPVIKNLEKIYDKVLVGGKIANEAQDEKFQFSERVILPVDFGPENNPESRLDIGPKTIQLFKDEIEKARTITWNGPPGKFEDEESATGTREIARAIGANQNAFKVIGGGETLEAVSQFDHLSNFNYVSMSGGAMLEFLEGKDLPGIKALEE